MAITGTGTEQDPYLVHDYDEIKTAVTDITSTNKYIKLMNDIDFKEDEHFRWESVTGNSSYHAELDLNNKTIMNFFIASNNLMFKYVNMKNGKIKNIFGEGATNIFDSCSINKCLVTSNITGFSGDIFNFCDFSNLSSICLQGKANTVFNSGTISDTWILPYITLTVTFINSTINNSKIGNDDILPRGYIKYAGNAARFLINSSGWGGNVIDIDIESSVNATFVQSPSSSSRNAVNVDDWTSTQKGSIPSDQQYTYETIRDFNTLSNNGFVVTEVVDNVI